MGVVVVELAGDAVSYRRCSCGREWGAVRVKSEGTSNSRRRRDPLIQIPPPTTTSTLDRTYSHILQDPRIHP
jgi:hypothetical protein